MKLKRRRAARRAALEKDLNMTEFMGEKQEIGTGSSTNSDTVNGVEDDRIEESPVADSDPIDMKKL